MRVPNFTEVKEFSTSNSDEAVPFGELQVLKEKMINYLQNPESHPRYDEEWKVFWVQKYEDLVKDGLDPNNHDFIEDWINYWPRKIVSIHKQEVEILKQNIRNQRNLPMSSDEENF
jgi:hypothetical protein